MLFWITLLLSLIFAYLGTRRGFYEVVVFSFNLGLSVYLGLFLTPYVVTTVPATLDIPGGLALTLFVLCLMCFLILFGASFLLFTGQFTVPFPKIFDVLISSVIGFMSGFFLVSFLCLILTMVPFTQANAMLENLNMDSNRDMICAVCDRIHAFVGRSDQYSTQTILHWLREKNEPPRTAPDSTQSRDPNTDPNSESNEPNHHHSHKKG